MWLPGTGRQSVFALCLVSRPVPLCFESGAEGFDDKCIAMHHVCELQLACDIVATPVLYLATAAAYHEFANAAGACAHAARGRQMDTLQVSSSSGSSSSSSMKVHHGINVSVSKLVVQFF
jgi:hypothetical protein